ncbi:aminotransferase class V-fold PLP-dependent enzyme [Leptolyngbya sp. AN02str]|uniref:aminotransferase class V-fold PLP-dependent enzyme n=1 Tax=Leptolyngbya sp. AN02str TaxID=3423363 RepID=UPI003D312391
MNDANQWRSLWTLDPAIAYLNHGSFGATPRAVLAQQNEWRQQVEAEPVQFFAERLEPLLDHARTKLGAFLGADPANLAFVPNATTGINTVLRSLALQPGDELLVTNHEYNASRNALDRVAALTQATIVLAEIPFPLERASQVVEAVMAKVSDRTRLFLIDHVTSQTALVLPIQPLICQLAQRGVDTLVDGAHAPGMIPLNLEELGAAYYTGNCHKWLCAPKGSAFLYVRKEFHARLRPLVISHGANSPRLEGVAPPEQARSQFRLEFDWVGTADPTPYLCIPQAIEYMGSLLPGGWPQLMQHNHELAVAARNLLCDRLHVPELCPAEMLGSMAVVPLPSHAPATLYQSLFQEFGIEVPIMPWCEPYPLLLRVSAQLYNTLADYDGLAQALTLLLKQE